MSGTTLSAFIGQFCLGLFCLGTFCNLGLFCQGLFCAGLFFQGTVQSVELVVFLFMSVQFKKCIRENLVLYELERLKRDFS